MLKKLSVISLFTCQEHVARFFDSICLEAKEQTICNGDLHWKHCKITFDFKRLILIYVLRFSFWETSSKSTLRLTSTTLTLSTTSVSLTNRFCVIKEYVKMWERPERCMLIKVILGTVVRRSDPKRWDQLFELNASHNLNKSLTFWFFCPYSILLQCCNQELSWFPCLSD